MRPRAKADSSSSSRSPIAAERAKAQANRPTTVAAISQIATAISSQLTTAPYRLRLEILEPVGSAQRAREGEAEAAYREAATAELAVDIDA